jgi:hypothetical protein
MKLFKICSRCKKEKQIEKFCRNASRKDGFSCYCTECFTKQRRNTPNAKLINMLHNAKRRAKMKGLDFDIDLKYLIDLRVDECPVLKIKLNWGRGQGLPADDSPSLDRIIPSIGYTKGNVWIISNRANAIKSNATPEELIAVANALLVR